MTEPGWSIDEWFVVALARTIRDREVVFQGFASPLCAGGDACPDVTVDDVERAVRQQEFGAADLARVFTLADA